MTPALQHNVGSVIAIATSILPQAAAANVNGASIDRVAHNLPLFSRGLSMMLFPNEQRLRRI